MHTVDISNNPIGGEGSKFLLLSILQHNDTIESLGPDLDKNLFMGVRNREELRQTLALNVSSHERKRTIMNKIEDTKKHNVKEKDVQVMDPKTRAEEATKMQNDGDTISDQLRYPLLKPIVFSNSCEDDFLNSGVWCLKDTHGKAYW